MKIGHSHSLLATLLLIATAFVGCNQSNTNSSIPLYTDSFYPTVVNVEFHKSTNLPTLDYSIDNVRGLIYNATPYPNGTKLDSAYLKMHLSTDCRVSITNELTQKVTQWSARDTSKIDVSGGKLTIEIAKGGKEKLSYKLRMQIYGYNPDRLTWKKNPNRLPIASEEGEVFMWKDNYYWLTRLNMQSSLYRIESLNEGRFTEMSTNLPLEVRAKSLRIDNSQGVWVVDKSEQLYYSNDLLSWNQVPTQGIQVSWLLYDLASANTTEPRMAVIGHREGSSDYYVYTATPNAVTQHYPYEATAPIRDAFAYVYTRAGATNANLIGGSDKADQAVPHCFFTSDGIHWGEIAYSTPGFSAPKSGALYVRHDNDLYIIGGVDKNGKPSDRIFRSSNRGFSWVELTKDEQIGSLLTPRHGLSGTITEEGGDLTYYFLGGMVKGTASAELWRAYLDKTGGIINPYNE